MESNDSPEIPDSVRGGEGGLGGGGGWRDNINPLASFRGSVTTVAGLKSGNDSPGRAKLDAFKGVAEA